MARSNGGVGPIVSDAGRPVVPELCMEREGTRLDVEQLTVILDGGETFTEKRRAIEKRILENPVFDQDNRYNLTNDENYMRGTEKFIESVKLNLHDLFEKIYLMRAINEEGGVMVQDNFRELIEYEGTEGQQQTWVPLAKTYSIIGTYAENEMGHGIHTDFVETTATYEPSAQEFVLHSPTLTSIKWWPPFLGHTATHAVVAARLITKDKDHGVHHFLVQLRNRKDHKRLPGMETGHVGPQFGFKGVDNGYLKMNNVHIPRQQMLMKYAQVSSDGFYSQSPDHDSGVHLIAMLRMMKIGVAIDIPARLAKAVTIATRYSAVRRQNRIKKDSKIEVKVLDYQTQQGKVLPLLATAYVFSFTNQYLIRMYLDIKNSVIKHSEESLDEHYATTTGLKAFMIDIACKGMETCRLACGGHGYLLASGIPTLYMDSTAYQSYEGESTLLYLRTAKYLHKMFNQQLTQSQLPPNIAYLASDFPKHTSCAAHSPDQFSDPKILLRAYLQRARSMVDIAVAQYELGKSSGQDDVAAWNISSVDWINAAKAHCHYVVLRVSLETVQNADVCPANKDILYALCYLYAVFGIVQPSGEFVLNEYMSTRQCRMARKSYYNLLKITRREAVPLVDAFDIPDAVLNSALGRYDGDVYTDLYERALKSPRNKSEVHDVYHKYLKPMLKKDSDSKL